MTVSVSIMVSRAIVCVILGACYVTPHTWQSNTRFSSSRLSMATGTHGQNFKFMPVVKGNAEEHFPRILQVAGTYPGLTLEDILAPSSSPASPVGFWTYSFPDSDDPNVGVVAIPGSDVITDCIDPVAIVTRSNQVGVQGEDTEMVIVLDRANKYFRDDCFYAYMNFENEIEIGWADSPEDIQSIIGKVVLTMMQANAMSKVPSGFLEDE